VLPSSLFPTFLAFEFSSLLFGLPVFGGFLLLEHFGVPEGFPPGELLRGQRLTGRLAPDVNILLYPALPALAWRPDFLGRDALSAPVGLVLRPASFGPLLVGQVELGTAALDSMDSPLDAVLSLGFSDFGRDVH
jgi:hypothetical protein